MARTLVGVCGGALVWTAPTLAFQATQLTKAGPAASRMGVVRSRPGSLRMVQSLAPADVLTVPQDVAPREPRRSLLEEVVGLSGLSGQALMNKRWPTKPEALSVIPKHCYEKDTATSLKYAATSLALTLACGFVGTMIPLQLIWLPVWLAYAAVTGTAATGCWVIAHEAGHGAFSNNKFIQDLVGYTFHSALLVPYFSWQRSHAVHHSRTNHMTEGETHVPELLSKSKGGAIKLKNSLHAKLGEQAGDTVFGIYNLIMHTVFGWPAYLLAGATGGPNRGVTNHFWPVKPFSTMEKGTDLFPGQWKNKVWLSDVGVFAFIGLLSAIASQVGVLPVLAVYGLPYLVVNAWLVVITWLQHTDVDVPHFEADNWTFTKGAFHSIDRPYGKVLDFLLHRIGSTHAVHHLDCTIPFYHAKEATEALKEAYPEHYLYDPTPLHVALWRVARKCVAVDKRGDKWVFVSGKE